MVTKQEIYRRQLQQKQTEVGPDSQKLEKTRLESNLACPEMAKVSHVRKRDDFWHWTIRLDGKPTFIGIATVLGFSVSFFIWCCDFYVPSSWLLFVLVGCLSTQVWFSIFQHLLYPTTTTLIPPPAIPKPDDNDHLSSDKDIYIQGLSLVEEKPEEASAGSTLVMGRSIHEHEVGHNMIAHTWSHISADTFPVRSATYLQKKKKKEVMSCLVLSHS